ncbi:MAG: tetratricopeptide repeat protein, partial [Proteobacteria bacterium]|nr:tetratricopeptide repeat protein [Pseudomonadota bacterium]
KATVQGATRVKEQIEAAKKIIPKIEDGNPQKSELLFQLAELYWDKSRYLYRREMLKFFEQQKDADEKKNRGEKVSEPKEDHRESELYRSETMRLYETILREYPSYERKDEVLFNLAYNLYETGKRDGAVKRYEELLKSYPGSKFVPDTYVQLGNHYFDVANVLEEMIAVWQRRSVTPDRNALNEWWQQINRWRQRNCLGYANDSKLIKPQHAIKRLYELTKDRDDVFITTEVGQHQMWAAQHYGFDKPNRWMTSGGLGTMGYGLPSAMGVQLAHPDALVVDIAGEASIMMNIQEMSTIAQYNLPVKVFILNNEYMGMVRQWQELLHGSRYSQSYMASLPDFVKLADAFGGVGLRAEKPEQLDDVIREMIETPRCVIADIMVDKAENCFPMIPSGAAHNEMLMGPADKAEQPISEDGMVLV